MRRITFNHLLYKLFGLFCVCAPLSLIADSENLLETIMTGGVSVNLRDPTFNDGVLTTTAGGVITAPEIRIQARHIIYTRKKIDDQLVVTIEAEEDLILEFNSRIFVGNRLEYDFSAKSGVLYQGRTGMEPWYFGGDTIYLQPDGNYLIQNAFVTTSENVRPEWGIFAEKATVIDHDQIKASKVQFRIFDIPVLRLPSFKMNLNSIFDNPIHYEVRAGSQGPRISVAYEIFSWERFKVFARLDYRLQRGWGGGFETSYHSADHKEKHETINFIARDAKSSAPHHVAIRYRFQGFYHKQMDSDKVTIDLSWDKLSDKEMATDYKERGLDIEAAGRTQLLVRKEADWWITNFTTRVRVNGFQTLKQELPCLETTIMPFELGESGVISQNKFSASYLDFKYADSIRDSDGYRSTRLTSSHQLYKPIPIGQFTATPEAGGLMIFEGSSPQHKPRFVGLGLFAFELDTRLHNFYRDFKHVCRPFARYEYYTAPTTSPNDHYIFDIDDGWYRLNMVRFGIDQSFYLKDGNGLIYRFLEADIWANAFFDSHTIPQTIPKAYGRFIWNSFPTLRHTCHTGWDFEEQQLDHFNFRTDWTVNSDAAIGVEYRHRSAYDWRKADPNNFFLDAFRSVSELRHSQLSDRRDTVLLHLFYRFLPTMAVEFESRHGWNRRHQPAYNEFEVSWLAALRASWNVKVSYQHLEDDDRITFAITLGSKRPDQKNYDSLIPFLNF